MELQDKDKRPTSQLKWPHNVKPSNERGFNMQSWEDLRKALITMKPGTKLYILVQQEMKKRGNWKNAPKFKK